jgi:putative ABC transport system permease protein
MMIAVVQRRREIGIVRSIGMRRRELLRLVLVETVFLAALGCVLAVPLGFALARALAGQYFASISQRFLPVESLGVSLRPAPLLWGVLLGGGTTTHVSCSRA